MTSELEVPTTLSSSSCSDAHCFCFLCSDHCLSHVPPISRLGSPGPHDQGQPPILSPLSSYLWLEKAVLPALCSAHLSILSEGERHLLRGACVLVLTCCPPICPERSTPLRPAHLQMALGE